VIKTCGRAKLMLVKVILIFTLFLNKPILFFNFEQAMMMRLNLKSLNNIIMYII
jgi:hypothetical protein